MRSLPVFGIGFFFAFGGVALFGWTLRKATSANGGKTTAVPVKKAELRALAAQQTEVNKIRAAAAIMVAVGAALMILSR